MIDKNVVKQIVDEWLADKEYFLVDVEISPSDKIVVEIDHADGVWINDCEDLSRFIEVMVEGKKRPQKMDVDHPFKMDQVKYTKYIISFK